MNVGQLFISLGFNVDNAKLKEFNDKISEAQKGLVKVGAGSVAAVYGINRFLNSSVKGAEALRNYREQTGFATEELLKFARVAERVNTNVRREDVIQTYSNIADAIGQAARGNLPEGGLWSGMAEYLYGSTPDEFLEKLREKIPELLAQYEQMEGGRSLLLQDLEGIGLSRDVAQAYLASQERWNAATNGMHTRTDEETAAIEKLAQSYVKLRHAYEDFSWRMSVKIAPNFEQFINFIETKALPVMEKLASQMVPFASDVTQGLVALGEGFTKLDGTLQTGLLLTLSLISKKLFFISSTLFLLSKVGEATKLGGDKGFWGGIQKGMFGWELFLGAKAEEGSQIAEQRKKRAKELGLDWDEFQLGIVPAGSRAGMQSFPEFLAPNGEPLRVTVPIGRRPEGYGDSRYPPQPFPIAPMEQSNTFNTNINTTANPRDMADAWSLLHEAYVRNISLDMLMGASGLQTSSGNAPASLLRR